MRVSELKKKILSGGFDGTFDILYKDVKKAQNRFAAACDEFIKLYGDTNDARLFSAPGRTEVGGNHTDHQNGRVLAGSVDLDVIAVVCPTNDGIITVKSEGYDKDVISSAELEIVPEETGRAISLIRGVAAFFVKNGHKIGGFNAYTTSNVLKGSGLSSSAAFEVLLCNILSGLYNDGTIDKVEIAKISQKAEREFFGKPCGLLDQSASSLGGFTAIDFADNQNPIVEQVDFDISAEGYALCVVNTGGNHANLTDDYAAITEECAKISGYFGKKVLREVSFENFLTQIAFLREKFGDRAVLRSLHFFNEDNRAELEKNALKNGDFKEFLRLVNESGNSSYKFLQNVYSNSDVSEQGISVGIAFTEQFLAQKGSGAVRVHGGGFAGTIQCFIPLDLLSEYKIYIEEIFGKDSCYILKIRALGGCEIK